ncbi:MAG: ATP-dependent Clp protease ATP-binding subunit ClpA, partial [Methylobacteriaceae bacterium]|nr:ATP-dependent Clp protease ATP-binding subunit ClpA [Methylobacteriaceae bacterium]
DRNVTIELTDESRKWLVEHGYDEAMGARPKARVIQQTIKTPLADEVLFGRLKNGGAVRVVVTADETGAKKLGFVYPEGPVLPRPERDIVEAGKKRARDDADENAGQERPRDDASDEDDGPPPVRPRSPKPTEVGEKPPGTVPKVPLRS